MKKLSSYQKLKLKIEELEKENHRLEKAIYEDDFYILYNVKMEYQMCLDLDGAYMAGESNYPKPKDNGKGFNEVDWMDQRINVRPSSFAEKFKTQLDNLPWWFKKPDDK